MDIRLAKDEAGWKRCFDYLNGKGTPCLNGTWLWYIEGATSAPSDPLGSKEPLPLGKGEMSIIACAGWNEETGGAIEPFQADDLKAAYKLFYFMQGVISGKGFAAIQCRTNNAEAIKVLEKEGFRLWTNSIKEYIKSV